MTHHQITWGIGSTGARCEVFQHDVDDLTGITCVECLKQLIMDYQVQVDSLKADLDYVKDLLKDYIDHMVEVDPSWRPSS